MTEKSAIFGAARVSVIEKQLLNKENLRSLIETDADGAMKLLSGRSYGGENAGSDNLESLIAGEIKYARGIVLELSSDPVCTDAFLLRHDITNLKLLIKLRLQGIEPDISALSKYGLYEPALLALMVKEWDFPELPELFREWLKKLDGELARDKNPQTVSVTLDKMYYSYVRSPGKPFLNEYFGTECDFVNLLTLMRMKKYDISKSLFESLLMPEYRLGLKTVCECFTKKELNPKKLVSGGFHGVEKTLCAALEGDNAFAVQKLKDDVLLSLIRERKNDMQSVYPVIWFYAAKVRESEIIRLVVTMKRSGFKNDKIEERLRELYG